MLSKEITEDNLVDSVKQWLRSCEKTLDFVYNQESSIPDLNVVEALEGPAQLKICDPYGYIQDPPLCNKIASVESATGKMIDHTTNYEISGKLVVKLKSGEELSGKWENGGRNGQGSISGPRLEKLGVTNIWGYYEDGILCGRGKVFTPGGVLETWFQHGYCHGPTRGTSGLDEVNWIGTYRAGLPHGIVWKKCLGGGWLVGNVDSRGELTGSRIAFLYPDMITCLVGEFKCGTLVRAKPAKISSVRLLQLGILCPQFENISEEEFCHWPSSDQAINCPLLLRDPYEEQLIEVRESNIADGGEGAFAKKDIPCGVVIAYYNGIRMTHLQQSPYEDSGYAIWLEIKQISQHGKKRGEHMDIPPEYHSWSQYKATSAHKLNHSFTPNCSWGKAFHPCLGVVPSVVTIENVSVGDELTIHYMMDMESAPEWYLNAWDKQM